MTPTLFTSYRFPIIKLNNYLFNSPTPTPRLLTLFYPGGAGVADQIADLKRGAEIVVCTPGRMIDILCMQVKMSTNDRVID